MKKLTATDIVISCENNLGFLPDPSKELWRARQIEASKIKRKLAASNPVVTLHDLALAVDLCWRRRAPVASPLYLFGWVEEARELANAVPVVAVDLSTDVQQAVAWELAAADCNHDWLGRLVRSHGAGREVVLHDWRAAGRG